MTFYRKILTDVVQLDYELEGINERGARIAVGFYVPESQQLVLITEEKETMERTWSKLSPEQQQAYRAWFEKEYRYQKERKAERDKRR